MLFFLLYLSIYTLHKLSHYTRKYRSLWPPGVLGILGEWPFIFRELGSTCNYSRGAREQAHNFGDLGSIAKKKK